MDRHIEYLRRLNCVAIACYLHGLRTLRRTGSTRQAKRWERVGDRILHKFYSMKTGEPS